ncbi:hypothetical protein UY3_06404 [Chelonia mydas]|uniref:Myb/SANT-like DNA-binding domain-containing protein n=1 Tax=Chelonia mydas TaxID=8469 RepID=M7C781_CHEMY|nr:hypothetical protein UY3_06404 [Chelonia mydas]
MGIMIPYRQISRYMTERGHDRDTLQCRVKVKELWNAYHEVREANRHSSAASMSYQFYKELDEILGGDPTSTAKATVDTSVARVRVKSGQSQEEEILDEDLEKEGNPEEEDDSEARDACSQELFSTPEEASQSQLLEFGEAQTGEEAPNHGTSEPDKDEKTTQDDMFQDMLQACATSENKTRAWRITLADSMEKKRVERRKA